MKDSRKYERLIIHGPREFVLYGEKYYGEYVLIDAAEDWSKEKEDLIAYRGYYDDGSQTKLYVRIDDPTETAEVIKRYKEIDTPVPIWDHANALYCDEDGKELAVWNTNAAKWHIPSERYKNEKD